MSLARARLLILVVCLVLHMPALFGGRVTDDSVNYLNAARAEPSFAGFARAFRVGVEFAHDGIRPPGIADAAVYFRPLTVASFRADLALFGTAGAPPHLVNALLQALCALLVHGLALRLLRDRRAALVAALLYLLHPAALFTSFWLSSRTDLLADLFMLAAFATLLPPAPGGRGALPGAALRPFCSTALFALALLSKESAAVFPAVAFLLLRSARIPSGRAGRSLLPHLALLPAWWVIRSHHIGGFHLPDVGFYTIHPGDPLFLLHALERAALAFLTLAAWFPTFPVKPLLPYPAWHLVFALALLPVAWGLFRLLFRGHPHPARRDALLAAALLLHAPTLWFLPAPHYFHGALAPFAIALAGALVPAGRRPRRLLRPYLAVAVAAAVASTALYGALLHAGERENGRLLGLLDASLDAARRAAPEATAEIHLVDLAPHAATALAEHRLTRPAAPPFVGRILTVAGPLQRPAQVAADSAEIMLIATGAPYGAGIIEWFAYARPVSVTTGEALLDADHRIAVAATARHPITGLPGAARIAVSFAEGAADAAHRRVLHAHPRFDNSGAGR